MQLAYIFAPALFPFVGQRAKLTAEKLCARVDVRLMDVQARAHTRWLKPVYTKVAALGASGVGCCCFLLGRCPVPY